MNHNPHAYDIVAHMIADEEARAHAERLSAKRGASTVPVPSKAAIAVWAQYVPFRPRPMAVRYFDWVAA